MVTHSFSVRHWHRYQWQSTNQEQQKAMHPCKPICVLCSNLWILSDNRKRYIKVVCLLLSFVCVNTGISPAWNSIRRHYYLVRNVGDFILCIIVALFWRDVSPPRFSVIYIKRLTISKMTPVKIHKITFEYVVHNMVARKQKKCV